MGVLRVGLVCDCVRERKERWFQGSFYFYFSKSRSFSFVLLLFFNLETFRASELALLVTCQLVVGQ